MKAKTAILIIALLCVTLLAGCQCKHEWTEADCLTPKTCSLCAVTEGDALGHNWKDATCDAPKTCAACGETEGTALEHNWEAATCSTPRTCSACGESQGAALPHTLEGCRALNESEMTGVCTVCGAEGTAPLDISVLEDASLLLAHKLEGIWDFFVWSDGSTYIGLRDVLGYYLKFNLDNTGIFYTDDGGEAEISWKYLALERRDNDLFLDFTAGGAFCALNCDHGYLYVYDDSYENFIVFSKNEELTSAISGTWANADNRQIQCLTFNEDRTVSGSLFGRQISGTWHLKPADTHDESFYLHELIILYTIDGTPTRATMHLDYPSSFDDLAEYLKYNVPTYYIYPALGEAGEPATYVKTDEEGIAQLEAQLENVSKPILGEWISTYCEYNHYAGWDWLGRDYKQAFDYRLNFGEDGTFTATFDQDYTGTWDCTDAEVTNGFSNYEYVLTFDGTEEDISVIVSFNHPDGIEAAKKEQACSMTFRYQPKGKDDVSIKFRQFTPESLRKAQDAVQQAVGTWTAISATHQKWETWEDLGEVPNCNFTLTINANGTYTVVLDRTYTGTWIYSPEGDDGGFLFSDSGSSNWAYLDDDGTLRGFNHRSGNYIFKIHFRRS